MQFHLNLNSTFSMFYYHLIFSQMGASESKSPDAASPPPSPAATPTEKPKCKACCACPETKKVRDAWYVNCVLL